MLELLEKAKLDILIPVYNEGKNIIKVLEALKLTVKTPFRVLICYDKETDDTLEALRQENITSCDVALVKNTDKGVHAAILSGFRFSQAPAVLVFPADDTYNPPIIDQMVQKFEEGCHIVAASRFMPGGTMQGCPWLKAFLVRSSAFALYHLARVPTRDPSNGLRLFSRRILDEIPIESTKGFTYSIELLVKAHRFGWKIDEVPALWFERTQGASRFKVLKWLPAYLRWVFYAFETTYLGKGSKETMIKNL